LTNTRQKVAETPPRPRKGPAPGERIWEAFTKAIETAKRSGNPRAWVNVKTYDSNRAYSIARMIQRGEYDVPGGVEAWEIEAHATKHKDGKFTSELWARRVYGKGAKP
jgi:hypothetical protein